MEPKDYVVTRAGQWLDADIEYLKMKKEAPFPEKNKARDAAKKALERAEDKLRASVIRLRRENEKKKGK